MTTIREEDAIWMIEEYESFLAELSGGGREEAISDLCEVIG